MKTRIGGYEIIELLGSGGMGDVWRAKRLHDSRIVALKTIRPERLPDAESRQRFAREASVLAKLDHPVIARVLDAGIGPVPFIAMELLSGETLRQRIARERMAIADALSCTSAIAEALAYAHAQGVVHRDVSPSNIHIDGSRFVLSDFGIAFLPGETRVTRTGALVGTAAYIAPELVREQEPIPASDVYSLGVVLFEMLTGELPFRAEGATMLAAARLIHPPLIPSELRPDLPHELDELVLSCLTMNPQHRPTAAELARVARSERAPRPQRPRIFIAGAAIAGTIALALTLVPARPKITVPSTPAPTATKSVPAAAPAAPPTQLRENSLKVSLLALGAETPAAYGVTRNLTKVTAANPGFGVADPERDFRENDQIAVLIESSSAGWLYVLNAGSDGVTRNIEEPKVTRVDANSPHLVGPFRIEPPAGVDTMTLLLTRERVAALERDGDVGKAFRSEVTRRQYGSTRRHEGHALWFEDDATGRIVATVPIRHRGDVE